jgi:hypothetical protein
MIWHLSWFLSIFGRHLSFSKWVGYILCDCCQNLRETVEDESFLRLCFDDSVDKVIIHNYFCICPQGAHSYFDTDSLQLSPWNPSVDRAILVRFTFGVNVIFFECIWRILMHTTSFGINNSIFWFNWLLHMSARLSVLGWFVAQIISTFMKSVNSFKWLRNSNSVRDTSCPLFDSFSSSCFVSTASILSMKITVDAISRA